MMLKPSILAAVVACLTVLSVVPSTEAHVGLQSPCPRYGAFKGCPAPPSGQAIDYDINSPIGTFDTISQPICKHTVPQANRPVYTAGQTIKTSYSVGASHGGGHCQWALSYDGGKNWVVIKTLIRDCLKNIPSGGDYSVNVQIPNNAPSGKATFMWLWNNAVGNRELYSNCADIEIKGTDGGKLTGDSPLIANYGKDSFYIGEFPNASDNDGSAQFSMRKAITVAVPKN
ncbi:hypothetical protein EDD21DRAFT_362280 [Dissophora ornata]|nr:hypothetical protein BGZ58_000310 [Dissophora ornata]KAI8605944.1 hypothetical protein EDD21DRAFT_362280 [Dissophora ornata]